ncbi:GMC oxidoreductase [Aspergillus sclerotialis]|uniref:glucose oxidase n=1 Tax=Aspergillus sclerotialis TaxID=2070753 RepID=A0A3A2ZUH9_9EURO|nr:GMC oxidoreductase [Aspergillus sclerotialis]
MLGGTSAINGQAYVANLKSNVDAWGRLGNPGWDWETLQPYYRKSYTLNLPSEEKQRKLGLECIDPKAHAGNGPIQVSYPDALQDPVAHAWVETFKRMGMFPSGDPYSGIDGGGFTNPSRINADSKTRSYSANAYYVPIKDRTNLRVATEPLVEKVILDASTNGDALAKGAKYVKDRQSYVVQARPEVIVSAGVFNSPNILEFSGIESRNLLERNGIKLSRVVLKRESVLQWLNKVSKIWVIHRGRKLFRCFATSADFNHPDTGSADLPSALQIIAAESDSGTPFSTELATHVRSILQNSTEATGGYFSFLVQADLKSSEGEAHKQIPGNYLTIAVGLMSHLSRGSSHIASADQTIPPTFDPRCLTHPLDLELLARHTRFIETIASSEPLASMLKPGGSRTPALPGDLRKVPLENVKEYVKSHSKSTFHPTSTCAMMPREKGGVGDSRLRVWGTKNLRVVDASAIPISPRGNTQSTVYAVAERAADIIKEDYGTK